MKLTITIVSLLMAAAGPVLAGEVVVHTTRTSSDQELIQAAFAACAHAFAEHMFPGQKAVFRPTLDVDKHQHQNLSSRVMETSLKDSATFELQAQLNRDRSILAEGSCTVSRDAQILRVAFRTAPAAKLAGLKISDIQLAMVSR